jgi:hypothetical protein
MFRWTISLLLLFVIRHNCAAQTYGFAAEMDTAFSNHFSCDELKMIIGEVQLYSKGKLLYHDSNYTVWNPIHRNKRSSISTHISDFTEEIIDSITFQLGVDSVSHYAEIGSIGILPNSDMYWSWQSGYIHFKLEGKDNSSHQKYQYHLGGFQSPFRCDQKIGLAVDTSLHNNFQIIFHLDAPLLQEFTTVPYKIMSPSQMSVNKMRVLVHQFEVKAYD